jgi:cytochrome P450
VTVADIYGSSISKSVPKDPEVYFRSPKVIMDIVSKVLLTSPVRTKVAYCLGLDLDDATHDRMRKLLNYAFSDQALRGQEKYVKKYIDLLIGKLSERAISDSQVDLTRWLNFTTFDIIGDLCFGESFGSLKNEDYNFWVANIFKGLKIARMFRVFRAYPIVGVPIFCLLKLFPQLARARQKHEQYTIDKTARRLNAESNRKDFMRYTAHIAWSDVY